MIRFFAYVWAGLIMGVSFLATPVKFRAETLTLPVALDVGRATFHALGRVEWILSIATLIVFVRATSQGQLTSIDWAMLGGVLVIVLAQTLWLVPLLDLRVAAIIDGRELGRSPLHAIFVGLELAKVLLLLGIGVWTPNHA